MCDLFIHEFIPNTFNVLQGTLRKNQHGISNKQIKIAHKKARQYYWNKMQF